MEHLLEQTIKYEFVELTAEVASRLRREYSRVGSAVMHERYAKIHREYEEKRRLEMRALEHFESLINYYIVSDLQMKKSINMQLRTMMNLIPWHKG
ncbi:MAG: hypothetical protein IPH31_04150 [Lewinellaceae bacterium]|nr:hypothetical protein [Lewinellaceae bacterium]